MRTKTGLCVLAALGFLLGCGQEGPAPPPTDDGASSAPQRQQKSTSVIAIDPPAGPGALAPRLKAMGGEALLTWLEPTQDGHRLLLSRLSDKAWAPPQEIQQGGDFFANWADVPGAAADAKGRLYAHALRKLGESTYAYGARLSSAAGGGSWQESGWVHDDTSATEHGFVSYVNEASGNLRAFWLDGRTMLGEGSMQLRTALLDGGRAAASELLDDRVCECCSTDAALTDSGPIVAYRDRSAGEIRDISIIRGTPEGWSEPRVVHNDGWHIFGCPVNGPALAAHGSEVALAWFSAPEDEARVQIAFSNDGGESFSSPQMIDNVNPLGRVDVEWLEVEGQLAAFVSWLGTMPEGDRAEIRFRSVTPGGELGPVQILAETSQARSAGVPQMIRHDGALLFAWIEEGEAPKLRVGRVDP